MTTPFDQASAKGKGWAGDAVSTRNIRASADAAPTQSVRASADTTAMQSVRTSADTASAQSARAFADTAPTQRARAFADTAPTQSVRASADATPTQRARASADTAPTQRARAFADTAPTQRARTSADTELTQRPSARFTQAQAPTKHRSRVLSALAGNGAAPRRFPHPCIWTACFALGAACRWAFTVGTDGYVGVSDLPVQMNSPLWWLYALLLGGLLTVAYTRLRGKRVNVLALVFGLIFGAVNYLCNVLFAYDSWASLASMGAWALTIIKMLLQGLPMAAFLALLCDGLERSSGKQGSRLQGNSHDLASVSGDAASQASAQRAAIASPTASAHGGMATTSQASAQCAATASPTASAHGGMATASPSACPQSSVSRRAPFLDRRLPRLARLYRAHPVLVSMAAMLLAWLPYLVAFFPGTVIWDMGEMIAQFFGQREMTTWHPVFTTWIFGTCVWLGRLIGSDNVGAFLFTLLQTLLQAYALAYAVRTLRDFGRGRRWQLAMLALCCLTPIFGSFAQAIGKDTIYTALLLLFALQTARVLHFGRVSPREAVAMGACALLTCLVRSNGLYVVLPTALLLVAFGVRKGRLRLGAPLAAAVACALLFSNVLVPALGVKDETASGLYSVCFQQSARTLRDHADDVTADEYAEIDRVLDAEHLATLYEPTISDPVKYTFRQYGSGKALEKQALARYRQTWLSMAKRFPLTYLESFVAGCSGYFAFTPKIDASRTYNAQGGIRFVFETYELGDDARYLHTVQPAALEKARTLLAAYSRGWRRVPILELAMFCGAYVWLLVGGALSLLRQRRFRELIAYIPALLSLGVCILSPVDDYFRYFLPVVAMTIPLLALAQKPQKPVESL